MVHVLLYFALAGTGPIYIYRSTGHFVGTVAVMRLFSQFPQYL